MNYLTNTLTVNIVHANIQQTTHNQQTNDIMNYLTNTMAVNILTTNTPSQLTNKQQRVTNPFMLFKSALL